MKTILPLFFLVLTIGLSSLSAQPTTGPSIKVTNAKNEVVLKVKQSDTKIKAILNNEVITSKIADKRKYHLQDSETILFTAKNADNKVKLKSDAGELLWKVKFKGTKVDFNNSEKGPALYTVKISNDEYKVYKGEEFIGKVKSSQENNKVKVKNSSGELLYKCNTEFQSIVFSLLLMNEIPQDQKAALICDLFHLGY